MARKKCIICSAGRGERVCKINDNDLICSVCCAKSRSEICEGCRHYAQARRYEREKSKHGFSKEDVIFEINPDVDEEVDHALALVEKGKFRVAKKMIARLLDAYPQLYIVHFGMGVVYAMQDQYDRALPYFDNAVEINPYFAEGWFNKATAHQKRIELPECISAFQKVVEIGDHTEHFVQHAKTFLRDMEKHIRDENGLSLHAYLENARIFEKAFEAMETGKWQEALEGFRKILAVDPEHVQSNGNMGLCLAYLQRKEEALEAFDNALELDPNYAPSIFNRQALLSLKGGETLAEKHFATVDYYKDKVLRE